MELARALVRWLSGSPPTQSSGLAAFLSQQRDARPAVLPNAPTYGHRQLVSQLPAHVVARSGRRRVCAAYRVSCVRGARPMRASLALASGEGGLGLGHPMLSADGLPAWRLRPADFCKPPPPELGRLPSSLVKVPPARLMCFLRARLAALGSAALPGSGRPTGRPATASGARASRLQSHRFHRL